MNLIPVFCFLFTLSIIHIGYCVENTEFENAHVERVIDLTSQLVKISYKITINRSQPEGAYKFSLTEDERKHLAYISARDSSKKEIKLTETKSATGLEYAMMLSGKSQNQVIYVETVFTKLLKPYPEMITQTEKQLVMYHGNIYFYSPYITRSQKTIVNLSSKNAIESYTQAKPVSVTDNTITYGPYEQIVSAYTISPLTVHFESSSPFLTVTKLERTIEVSHWGNIAIEETINIVNSGALLKGSFSRYDFQKDTRYNQPCVKSYKTILPASASGVYYRDVNGNISTSNMKIMKDSVELDLRPRFPLFGGWKTHYTLGYNVPSFEYLFNSDDNYQLKMRVVDHIFDDMVIDEAIIKIILPEGSTKIKLITPYSVTRLPDSLHYTYLDTFGRPVISFTKQNLVENHMLSFSLKYNFSKTMLLQEPLLIIGFLFTSLLFIVICSRLDFSIYEEKSIH